MNARRKCSCQGTENTYLDAPENKLADASNGVIRKLEMACAGAVLHAGLPLILVFGQCALQ
jgi:hypothetical protein